MIQFPLTGSSAGMAGTEARPIEDAETVRKRRAREEARRRVASAEEVEFKEQPVTFLIGQDDLP